jgi:hypothetical protein
MVLVNVTNPKSKSNVWTYMYESCRRCQRERRYPDSSITMHAKSGSTAVCCIFVNVSVRRLLYMASRGEDFTLQMSETGVKYGSDLVIGDWC